MPKVAGCRFGDAGSSLPWLVGLHPILQIGELRLREHLRQSVVDNQRASSLTPSALRPEQAATMASDETTSHSTRLAKTLAKSLVMLTSRSTLRRRPFSHEARSPRVGTHSFTAQPPDLRRFALITRASRFHARSPCSATPSIRFLSIGSQLRSTLPPHTRSPSCSCASLRSL